MYKCSVQIHFAILSSTHEMQALHKKILIADLSNPQIEFNVTYLIRF